MSNPGRVVARRFGRPDPELNVLGEKVSGALGCDPEKKPEYRGSSELD